MTVGINIESKAPQIIQPTGNVIDADGDPMDFGGKTLDELVAPLLNGNDGVLVQQPPSQQDSSVQKPQTNTTQNPPKTWEELQQRLGVKLEDIQFSNGSETTSEQKQEEVAESTEAEKETTDGSKQEETAQGFQWDAFESQFEEKFGIPLKEAVEGIKALQSQLVEFQTEYSTAREMAKLQRVWGVDDNEFDRRLQKVAEYSQKLPPDMLQKLDNVDGAQLLWAKIELEESKARPTALPMAPKFLSGSKTPVTQRTTPSVIKASMFFGESPEQKAYFFANQAAIQDAMNKGLIEWDVQT